VAQVDLVNLPDHPPQARLGSPGQIPDRPLQDTARPGAAALKDAARMRRGTVHPAAARQFFPAPQLARNVAGLNHSVLDDGDRSDHGRAYPVHMMNDPVVRTADRLFTPDHVRGPTPHGPFGQATWANYR
jgi:hypothetical protein